MLKNKNNNINDEEALEKTKNNFIWAQEFSKKIIIVLFILYIIYFLASLIALYRLIYCGNVVGFETLTTEINETFRFIVGGYIIKSAFENVTKIGGNYYNEISKIKIFKKKEESGVPTNTEENNNDYCEYNDEFNNDGV